MQMIKVEPFYNGGHSNQTYHGVLPEGWAVIPDDMDMPNFPFGEVAAGEIDGVMTVTGWTPGVIPESGPDEVPTQQDETTQLNAKLEYIAMMTDIDLEEV